MTPPYSIPQLFPDILATPEQSFPGYEPSFLILSPVSCPPIKSGGWSGGLLSRELTIVAPHSSFTQRGGGGERVLQQ
jgi:hypothetical protein